MNRAQLLAAWAAIAALAWHAARSSARTHRLEQVTGAWRVADPRPRPTAPPRRPAAHPAGRRWPRGPIEVKGHG